MYRPQFLTDTFCIKLLLYIYYYLECIYLSKRLLLILPAYILIHSLHFDQLEGTYNSHNVFIPDV